ncbi:MAG: glycoside hydrolase family 28 protein [Acidobacteriaceae bacterium]|nr:glycoside hydrolase family 28 protein [Acidobacteriaceae bacterium]
MKRVVTAAAVIAMAAGVAQAQKVCDVRTFGAKGDGVTKDTAAIQKAIDSCAAAKGGTVKIAGGTFLSAPLMLKSNITLDVEKGATLLGSPDHADYPKKREFKAPGYQAFLSAEGAKHITINGGGVIDGNGKTWWESVRGTKDAGLLGSENTRPRGLVFDHCDGILIENVTVQNMAYWQIVPYYSNNIVIRDVKVLADPHSPNTDAIDPFSSTNVLIERVLADVGDDNIAIKSGMVNSPGPDAPTKNVVIRDCTFLHGHGLSIGSEIAGGAQNIVAENITFKGTGNGLRIKANRDRGADVSHIVFKHVKMEDVKMPILVSAYYPKAFPQGEVKTEAVGRLTPFFHDIVFDDVTATGSEEGGGIVGLPEAPIKNIVLKHVHISSEKPMRVAYANALFDDVTVTVAGGGEGVVKAPTATITKMGQSR